MSEIGLMSPPPLGIEHGDIGPACRVCGCSQFDACEEGCWWIPDPKDLGPLCSSCEDEA